MSLAASAMDCTLHTHNIEYQSMDSCDMYRHEDKRFFTDISEDFNRVLREFLSAKLKRTDIRKSVLSRAWTVGPNKN